MPQAELREVGWFARVVTSAVAGTRGSWLVCWGGNIIFGHFLVFFSDCNTFPLFLADTMPPKTKNRFLRLSTAESGTTEKRLGSEMKRGLGANRQVMK